MKRTPARRTEPVRTGPPRGHIQKSPESPASDASGDLFCAQSKSNSRFQTSPAQVGLPLQPLFCGEIVKQKGSKMRETTQDPMELFRKHLINEEKSQATIEKYLHDVTRFHLWLGKRELCKAEVLAYKTELCRQYAPSSVNVALSSLKNFFSFMEWENLGVRSLKIQKQIFSSTAKELTKAEYDRLLETAKQQENIRLYLLLQTICSTGIRVSEVQHITTEAIRRGVAEINCKGKRRQVFLPKQLCGILQQYCCAQEIKNGAVFVTRNGKPLDRSNIWGNMKKLCHAAGIPKEKVFPHNLRHLFARTHYRLQKDIVRLADILGHTSVNTTRIYTMETGEVHRKQIEKLGLLLQ